MVLWGHPVTTGAPAIDYFVTSDAFHVDADGTRPARQRRMRFDARDHGRPRPLLSPYFTATSGGNGGNMDRSHSHSNGHSDNDGDGDADEMHDGYAQAMFSEQLVRLSSLGYYFDRSPALHTVEQAMVGVNGTEGAAAAAEVSARRRAVGLLIERPRRYYAALRRHARGGPTRARRQPTTPATTPSSAATGPDAAPVQTPTQLLEDGRTWSLPDLIQRRADGARLVLCPQVVSRARIDSSVHTAASPVDSRTFSHSPSPSHVPVSLSLFFLFPYHSLYSTCPSSTRASTRPSRASCSAP
jgi:hypothetical protein